MIRSFSFMLFIIACLFSACSNKMSAKNNRVLLAAWNEDSIMSYKLALLENKTFYYSLTLEKGDLPVTTAFLGTYNYSADSVLLHFDNKWKEVNLTNYLLVEALGSYLIQYFINNNKRMFLRIQKRYHRF